MVRKYPYYLQEVHGKTQIKVISPFTYSAVSLAMGEVEYTRSFDVRCSMTEFDQKRFAELPRSTEEAFRAHVKKYMEYLLKIGHEYLSEDFQCPYCVTQNNPSNEN